MDPAIVIGFSISLALACGCAGFLLGRFSAPVSTHDRAEIRLHQRQVTAALLEQLGHQEAAEIVRTHSTWG